MGISVKNLAPAIIDGTGSFFSFKVTDDCDREWFLSITQQIGDGVFDWHFYLQSPSGEEFDLKTDVFPRRENAAGFNLESAWDVLMLMGIIKHDGVSRKTAA